MTAPNLASASSVVAADRFCVEGKTVLVTGGAGGIGAMLAGGLVDAGARVMVTSRDRERGAAVADELSKRGSCVAIVADVTDPDDVERVAGEVRASTDGFLDVLINNAGATWGAPVERYPSEAWERVVATNLTGVFNLTVALLPALRGAASRGGPARVINVGSVDGVRPPAWENYAYSASKAGVHQLTRHLARRLAPESITVNALAPGPFASRMTAFLVGDDRRRAELENRVPLRRIGDADDIVGAVIFLASRAGAYVTGTVLPVDGGITGCS